MACEWIKDSFAVTWSQNYRRAGLHHASELDAVPQSLSRSLAQLCSGLRSQLIADQRSQHHLLRDTRSISAEKQPQNTMYPYN